MTVRRWIALALNLLLAVMVFRAWGRMFFQRDDSGRLSAVGWGSLKFFTILSNLLEGVAAALTALWLILLLCGAVADMPRWLTLLRYAAAVSVSLTCVTVLAFLGPIYGYGAMFKGANLTLHLLVPLLAVAVFLWMDRGPITFPETLWAVLPMFLYGVGYMINVGLHHGAKETDWYALVQGSVLRGIISSVVMIGAAWLLALLLRLPGER